MTKERLDVVLVNKGFFASRERAKGAIMAGNVFIDNIRVDKCGEKINPDAEIVVKGHDIPYVSRGGLKLEKAIKEFGTNVSNKVCFDIGASTGGFTDCMLMNGATKVYAVDVGYGQLAWKLRTDERVVCMERTNVRYLKKEDIEDVPSFASIDVSFISLKKVVPVVSSLMSDDGEIVALIKPQFEAGRDKVGKKGVVREKETHREVVTDIVNFLKENDFGIIGLTYSPIKGPEGNREYLVYFKKNCEDAIDIESSINEVIENSHISL